MNMIGQPISPIVYENWPPQNELIPQYLDVPTGLQTPI